MMIPPSIALLDSISEMRRFRAGSDPSRSPIGLYGESMQRERYGPNDENDCSKIFDGQAGYAAFFIGPALSVY
jgi:hypothetical protein